MATIPAKTEISDTYPNPSNAVARIGFARLYDWIMETLGMWVVAGGSASAMTATYSPAVTTLVDGQVCRIRAIAVNTTTNPTFSPNGLTARTITKTGGVALVIGEIAVGQELILKYNLANTRWELTNSVTSVANDTHRATTKATPIDADIIPLSDSAASFGLKGLTWANIKATLQGVTWNNATNSTNVTGTTTASIISSALGTGASDGTKILYGDRTWGAAPSVSVTSVVGQTGAVTASQVRDALLTVDGAASGLDADLLDGQHASAFAGANKNFEWEVLNASYSTGAIAGDGYGGSINLQSNYGAGIYKLRKTNTDTVVSPSAYSLVGYAIPCGVAFGSSSAMTYQNAEHVVFIGTTVTTLMFFATGAGGTGIYEISKLRKLT